MSCYYRTPNDIPIEPSYKIENLNQNNIIPKDIPLTNTSEDDIREILELEIKRIFNFNYIYR